MHVILNCRQQAACLLACVQSADTVDLLLYCSQAQPASSTPWLRYLVALWARSHTTHTTHTNAGATGELNPMAAMFGGFVGQEVVKAVSGKFTPLHQWFYFDSLESLPDDILPEAEYEQTGSRCVDNCVFCVVCVLCVPRGVKSVPFAILPEEE